MIKTVSLFDFQRAFQDYGRENNFTPRAQEALFDYIEQLEDECGEQIELDVIALCCRWTEYADLEAIQADYSSIESLEDLQDRTVVIEFKDGYLVDEF